ncbi:MULTISPECIES: ABC transporter substrate-binding protein [Paenibacillus]|uniref:Sugar ABC transporter substrate-binding protein n=1 Tax=Paenibacillus vini TaxID=1476024 RepID=A0ABQ4MEW0_9BACL|nr:MULTISPECIES: ABC transporter substrate-binding protein [Paenibacillus]MBQ4901072.1 ABC transporter substrate-binding protein [Paenibacillus sp. Marseille-P2973]MDN4068195.1 ABC transporter substrate-binding protein [Paenibacillus vini]GIP54529.1 sugar ABC transporter substrate-binding protein [Paenibacillus vini]
MKKSFGIVLALFLSLSLILSACGGSNSGKSGNNGGTDTTNEGTGNQGNGSASDDGGGEKVTLSFWTLFSGGDGDNMQAMIDAFNKEHPNIQVKNTKLEWGEYYTKLITAVGNGNGPDVGISHISRLPDLIDQGVVSELDDVAEEAGVDWATFNQNILEASIVDGAHYAVPIDTHPFIMYYNKKLLKEAGLLDDEGKPIMEQSADGFVTFLTTLKEKLPQKVTPFAMSNANDDPFRLWWALYSQLGGNDVVSDDLNSAQIDTDKAVKAAQYVQDLFHKHKVIKLNDPDFYKNFQSGTAAIMMTGVWATGTWESTKDLEFGAMPIPKVFDQEATWGDSHTVILPVTKKEDPAKRKAAITFANWLADNGQVWAKAGHIPSKPSVFEKQEFKDLPYRSDYVSVASTVKFNKPSTKNWQIRDLAMFKYLNEVWANKLSPADGIAKMSDEVQKVLSE